ncbi:MAG: hypothetical protein HPM95_11205 [Alphaproteobacteria bacterium]|nr:hypothetical protein [Alphaproteobacteria bacterium]
MRRAAHPSSTGFSGCWSLIVRRPAGQWVDRILPDLHRRHGGAGGAGDGPSIQQEWSGLLDAFEVRGRCGLPDGIPAAVGGGSSSAVSSASKPLQAACAMPCGGALIDLLAVLPFFIGFLFPAGDFKALVVLQLLRFFNARYSPALRSLPMRLPENATRSAPTSVIIFGVMLLAATEHVPGRTHGSSRHARHDPARHVVGTGDPDRGRLAWRWCR